MKCKRCGKPREYVESDICGSCFDDIRDEMKFEELEAESQRDEDEANYNRMIGESIENTGHTDLW